jgi:hypothetical protein
VMIQYYRHKDGDDSEHSFYLELISNILSAICNILTGPTGLLAHELFESLDAPGTAGTCEMLLSILAGYKSNAKIVEYSIWAISLLAVHPKNRSRFTSLLVQVPTLTVPTASATAPSLLMEVLSMYRNNISVIDVCCLALNNLSHQNVDFVVKLIQMGSCELMVDILRLHVMDPNIFCKIFSPLLQLAETKEGKVKFSHTDLCILSVDLLMRHQSNAMVVTEVGGVLCWIIQDEGSRRRVADVGGCTLLVKLLRNYMKDAVIVELIVGSICNMTCDNPSNRLLFTQEGCQTLLLYDVLKEHKENVLIVEVIARSSINIIDGVELDSQLGQLGVCELLIEVLNNHVDSADVATLCYVIYHLARLNTDNAQKVREVNGYKVFLKILQKHANDVKVVKGCSAAHNEINIDDPTMVELAHGRYGEILTKLLKTHFCNSNSHCDIMLLLNLCVGMVRFSGLEIGRNQLVQVEAHAILLQIMKEYLKNLKIIKLICMVLANMAQVGPDQKVKISGGINGCKRVVLVLKVHGSDEIVADKISSIIRNLTANCPENRCQLTQAGCHEALL